MKKRGWVILPLLFYGCATYQPVIDTRGVDTNRMKADLAECDEIAEQASPTTRTVLSSAFGAIVGGAAGAIIGWTFDDNPGLSAAQGAAAGALIGGAVSGAGNVADYEEIMRTCMRLRGYTVIK